MQLCGSILLMSLTFNDILVVDPHLCCRKLKKSNVKHTLWRLVLKRDTPKNRNRI
jgi:hypothetical protein